jgi:hypothetical protein
VLDDGHDVTVVTNRTPEEMRTGPLMSGQVMFGSALATEPARGIDLWQEECPQIEGMTFVVSNPAGPGPLVDWEQRLDQAAQSVDQRVKFPTCGIGCRDLGGLACAAYHARGLCFGPGVRVRAIGCVGAPGELDQGFGTGEVFTASFQSSQSPGSWRTRWWIRWAGL